jgi:hypothetical protein
LATALAMAPKAPMPRPATFDLARATSATSDSHREAPLPDWVAAATPGEVLWKLDREAGLRPLPVIARPATERQLQVRWPSTAFPASAFRQSGDYRHLASDSKDSDE